MEDKKKPEPDDEERLEDHEAEMAAKDAEEELGQEMVKISEREYQKMSADLRWEVLEYVDAHPERPVKEVAEFFGLREGTIRAWKAHLTMGTYQQSSGSREQGTSSGKSKSPSLRKRGRQGSLFKEKKEAKTKAFLERKRHSNFIHYFDKTPPGIVCPHFYILAHANGCPFSCDYCYLKLTLRHYPEPTVFTNTARLFQELRDWLLSREEPSVLNTGELSDSLAWDTDTSLSTNLVSLFANQSRHKLLFLTKSTVIDNLLEMEPTPQVIVSFSVNARGVAERFERGAPAPESRIDTAKKLKDAGWQVRIRLDPMIPVEGWEDDYGKIIDQINELEPEVVTLGSLRYFKNLLNHASKDTDVFSFGHNHGDPDARLRIKEEIRNEMYRFCLDRLACLRVGLCKETGEMHQALGLPGSNQSCNCTIE